MKIRLTLPFILFCVSFSYQALSSEERIAKLHDHLITLEKEVNLAKEKQALWRDTTMLLSQAKSSLASNEIEKTQEIINQITFQLQKSLEQSNSQNDISNLVPYYLKD